MKRCLLSLIIMGIPIKTAMETIQAQLERVFSNTQEGEKEEFLTIMENSMGISQTSEDRTIWSGNSPT